MYHYTDYTWYYICSAWFLDIKISTCFYTVPDNSSHYVSVNLIMSLWYVILRFKSYFVYCKSTMKQYYRGQYYRGYVQSVTHSYYISTVKVCHFESLSPYTGVAYQKHAKPVLPKQVAISYSRIMSYRVSPKALFSDS